MSGGHVPSSWRLGATPRIELNVPGMRPDGLISLVNGSQKLIPQIQRQGNRLSLGIMDGILEPGHYDVMLDGQPLGGEMVALNASSDESRLQYWSPESLVDMSKERGWNSYVIQDSSVAGGILAEAGASTLWRWLLAGVLLCLLVEMFLVRLMT